MVLWANLYFGAPLQVSSIAAGRQTGAGVTPHPHVLGLAIPEQLLEVVGGWAGHYTSCLGQGSAQGGMGWGGGECCCECQLLINMYAYMCVCLAHPNHDALRGHPCFPLLRPALPC